MAYKHQLFRGSYNSVWHVEPIIKKPKHNFKNKWHNNCKKGYKPFLDSFGKDSNGVSGGQQQDCYKWKSGSQKYLQSGSKSGHQNSSASTFNNGCQNYVEPNSNNEYRAYQQTSVKNGYQKYPATNSRNGYQNYSSSSKNEFENYPGPSSNSANQNYPSSSAKNGPNHQHHQGSNFKEQYKRNKLQEQRKALPIFSGKKRLMQEFKKNPTVILIGETGSGKTTQLPQYLHECDWDKNGMIAITQPRRVAAITIARRVAEETGTTLGDLVGYCVRFEDMTSSRTRLKYVTDGMLLREAMSDNLLQRYSVVILDEAHERTVHTDVLFGIVKKAQEKRLEMKKQPLKIVVMSATMDVDHFSNYFNKAPVLYLEGRQYPVQVLQAKSLEDDYVFSTIVTIFQAHRESPANHHMLVFLTGQEEIETAARYIRQVSRELQGSYPPITVLPLYASLPPQQQLRVFADPPPGHRKIILSTNIAETSVTISGIKIVIDSGMVKERTYHSKTGLEILRVQHISKAQAWQRAGRVGRESEGTCYRVYTKEIFEAMSKDMVPEIKRCNLASVVLQLLAMEIKDIVQFNFMDAPPKEAVLTAMQELFSLGATTDAEKPELTKLGRKMARFPLEPRFAKVILSSKKYGCTDEILTIIALLSGDSVLINPADKKEKAEKVRHKFVSSEGDHITLLNIYRTYNHMKDKDSWCYEHFIHSRRMAHVCDVRKQLYELCQRCRIPSASCGEQTEQVRKCLLTGLFTSVAELQKEGHYLTVPTREVVSIHPSSVLFRSKPSYILFTDLVHTGKCYIKTLSLIDPDWYPELGLKLRNQHRSFTSKSTLKN